MKNPLRINSALLESARQEGSVKKRSIPNQIEYWAELGRAVERVLEPGDVYAVTQGFKKITVEPVFPLAVNPDTVFASIEKSRKKGSLAKQVTSAPVYYESSPGRPGLIDRVNSATGERHTGSFLGGKFVPA